MTRLFRLAATVWLAIAGFAAINRAFEAKELAPMLGDDVAEFLGTASLAGFVFLIAFLWLGTRERALTAFEAFVISATWLGCGLVLALSMSGHPYLASWREALAFLAASAAAPWAVRWALTLAVRGHFRPPDNGRRSDSLSPSS